MGAEANRPQLGSRENRATGASKHMGYPLRLLSEGEVVETQFRPHWSGVIREGLILLAGVAAAVAVAILGWPAWLYIAIAVLVILFVIRGFVRWLTTAHVITNERIIYRAGFVAKQGTEIPLEVIQNDRKMSFRSSQKLARRMYRRSRRNLLVRGTSRDAKTCARPVSPGLTQ